MLEASPDVNSLKKSKTRYESIRDKTNTLLYESTLFQILAIIYIILVIGDGAFFFFMMVGWHYPYPESISRWWLNLSIQILCGAFSYPAVINLPWLVGMVVHTRGERGGVGLNFYGDKSVDVFLNLELRKR
ncbi:hypothetical protein TL16_g03918 [Triparma laevis f. inornata]|nr:hypothetical protein TL16_g03918 [Triparma laevis f. inornata]